MNSAETKQKIVAAVAAGFGSIGGIKRQAGIEAYRDISEMISELIEQKEIRRVSKGDLVAYFPYSRMPSNFYFAGGGRVEAEYVEGFTPRDDAAKAAEMTGIAAFNAPITPNAAKMTDNRPRKPSKTRRDIDPADLEQLAATLADASAVANALGFKDKSSLYYKLKQSASLTEAWKRGRAKNPDASKRGSKPGVRRGPRQTVKKVAADPLRTYCQTCGNKFDDGHLNDDGVCEGCMENIPLDKAAEAADIGFPLKPLGRVIVTGINDKGLGIAATNSDVTVQPKSRPEFEGLDAFVQTVKKRQPVRVHHRHIDLKNGGQIVVGFEGNVFDLTPDEHSLLISLSAVIAGYETEPENTEFAG